MAALRSKVLVENYVYLMLQNHIIGLYKPVYFSVLNVYVLLLIIVYM